MCIATGPAFRGQACPWGRAVGRLEWRVPTVLPEDGWVWGGKDTESDANFSGRHDQEAFTGRKEVGSGHSSPLPLAEAQLLPCS